MEDPLRRAVGVLVFARRGQALETPHFPPLQKGSEQEAPEWDTHYKPLMISFEKFTFHILPVLALGWKASPSASQQQVWDSPPWAPQGEQAVQLLTTPCWGPWHPALCWQTSFWVGAVSAKSWRGFPTGGIGVHSESSFQKLPNISKHWPERPPYYFVGSPSYRMTC